PCADASLRSRAAGPAVGRSPGATDPRSRTAPRRAAAPRKGLRALRAPHGAAATRPPRPHAARPPRGHWPPPPGPAPDAPTCATTAAADAGRRATCCVQSTVSRAPAARAPRRVGRYGAITAQTRRPPPPPPRPRPAECETRDPGSTAPRRRTAPPGRARPPL